MSLKSSILLITVFLISCNSVDDNNDLVFKGTDINGIEFNSKEGISEWFNYKGYTYIFETIAK